MTPEVEAAATWLLINRPRVTRQAQRARQGMSVRVTVRGTHHRVTELELKLLLAKLVLLGKITL